MSTNHLFHPLGLSQSSPPIHVLESPNITTSMACPSLPDSMTGSWFWATTKWGLDKKTANANTNLKHFIIYSPSGLFLLRNFSTGFFSMRGFCHNESPIFVYRGAKVRKIVWIFDVNYKICVTRPLIYFKRQTRAKTLINAKRRYVDCLCLNMTEKKIIFGDKSNPTDLWN